MVLYNELPVYRDTYNLMVEVYQVTSRFSHEFKYSLGQDMKRDVLSLFRNLYRANRSSVKHVYLEDFLSDFELLKVEMRLCVDLKLLPIKKMAQLSKLTDAIGKQVTAWRNRTMNNSSGNLLSAWLRSAECATFYQKRTVCNLVLYKLLRY